AVRPAGGRTRRPRTPGPGDRNATSPAQRCAILDGTEGSAMRLPTIEGVIRRRLLLNFRLDPDVAARELPAPFAPKLHGGHAIVGVCLIRLEHMRPLHAPKALGVSSENAAHRFAITWPSATGEQEGVFIPRRDSSSLLNQLAGGRIFPG